MATVRDDVAFGPANLGLRSAELDAAVDRALALVGMAGRGGAQPHHLSAGERRRVALATVLSMDPQVLVLDEPSAHLDPAGRRELVEVLQALDHPLDRKSVVSGKRGPVRVDLGGRRNIKKKTN